MAHLMVLEEVEDFDHFYFRTKLEEGSFTERLTLPSQWKPSC